MSSDAFSSADSKRSAPYRVSVSCSIVLALVMAEVMVGLASTQADITDAKPSSTQRAILHSPLPALYRLPALDREMAYILTAPAVMPAMNVRMEKRNSRTRGTEARTEAAMECPGSG